MSNIGMLQYKKGIDLFEKNKYDEAVSCLIKAYDEGVMCEDILQDLYSCFITPNEQEFRDTYAACDMDLDDLEYEDTVLDFVPVTDIKYYIYNKSSKAFCGALELSHDDVSLPASHESLLIAEPVDINEAVSLFIAKKWEHVYFVLDSQAAVWFSFCKIPGFVREYMQKIKIFKNMEELTSYFRENTDVYLPRKICGADYKGYGLVLDEIHKERLADVNTKRNNILLSVCIPTYNRGKLALRAVKNILQCSYDAEIEIVISNNGSEDREGYEEIKAISDSRVRYFEFEKNMGYAYNFRTVLDKADGRFAVLSSDEDLLIVERLPEFLDFLMGCENIGIISTGGVGPNFSNMDTQILQPGLDAMACALGRNYITGLTFNNKCLKAYGVINRYDQYKDLSFLVLYPHCGMAFMAAQKSGIAFSEIQLWIAKEEPVSADDREILSYMTLESRIEQQNSCIMFLEKAGGLEKPDFLCLMATQMDNTYRLLSVGFYILTNAFIKKYDWLCVCVGVYKNNIGVYKGLTGVDDDTLDNFGDLLRDTFIKYIETNPAERLQSERDKMIQKIAADIIKYHTNNGKNIDEADITDIRKGLEGLL